MTVAIKNNNLYVEFHTAAAHVCDDDDNNNNNNNNNNKKIYICGGE